MNLPVSELNDLPILTPSEIEEQAIAILGDLKNSPIPQMDTEQLIERLEDFKYQWQKAFTEFGQHYQGELAYRDLIADFAEKIAPLVKKWLPPSETGNLAVNAIISMLPTPKPVSLPLNKRLSIARKKLKAKLERDKNQNFLIPEFEKPIFIVSAPRAGSSLLFETLAQFPDLWTIGDESHKIIEGIPALHPAARNFTSNRLIESDATPEIGSNLRKGFVQQLQNREGVEYLHIPEPERPNKIRFLEKTPKNAFRVPFIKAIFPDALFIYLYRDPKENISSLMEGWRSQRFISYQPLPGWPYRNWSFFLFPGWSSLQKSSLVEIAAYQWKTANSCLIEDLKTLDSSCWHLVNYQDLVERSQKTINDIAEFAQLHQDQHIEQMLSQPLAIAQRTLSTPSAEKWRKNARELATVLPDLENLINILEKANF
ncbi:sulfotransferase family protein [Dolichospermum circinale]|uniref:sulfotransferase family protein n=1 Tax=Dolichospermum circinale TaxID=109265 RepID=UPI00233002BF|nr:sulfotransferase [Dolichospermum circinale]MDB9450210.1 sulfotransferase [Dolichospermum circinale CS-547]